MGQTAVGVAGASSDPSSTTVSGGFYGKGGIPPAPLTPSGGALGITPLVRAGVFSGVPYTSSFTLTFNTLMAASSLSDAVELRLVQDRLGQTLATPTTSSLNAYGWSFNTIANQLVIGPPAGRWEGNTVYEVGLSTLAIGFDGSPLASSATFRFYTMVDPTVASIASDPADPAMQVRTEANAFAEPFSIVSNASPAALTVQSIAGDANAKLGASPVFLREITATNAANQPLALQAPGKATLVAALNDADQDGFVDGSGGQARMNSLSWAVLDENKRLWVRIPDTQVDAAAGRVSAPAPHFSVFAVVPQAANSVSDAYAFPVPFRPNGANAGSGAGKTGTNAGGITFINLPSQGSIEVFNVRGESVWRTDIPNASGRLTWNVRNSAGQDVASGVYLYVIKSQTEKKTGKLAVIR